MNKSVFHIVILLEVHKEYIHPYGGGDRAAHYYCDYTALCGDTHDNCVLTLHPNSQLGYVRVWEHFPKDVCEICNLLALEFG